MEIASLIRDPQRIIDCLTEFEDGRLVTSKKLKIYIPTRFETRGMAYIGLENYIIGIYAIVLDDMYYGVSTINAMIHIDPSEINKIKVNGDEYYEFVFNPGTTMIKSTSLVKTDSIPYKIYDEIFSKGYTPWYLGYNDLATIFDTAQYHAGANIGQNQEVTELLVSIVSRNRQDKTQYYRTIIKSLKDLTTNPPVFIPLRDVTYAATNTTNRLGGSYFQTGLVAALNNPSERTEKIESYLRS